MLLVDYEGNEIVEFASLYKEAMPLLGRVIFPYVSSCYYEPDDGIHNAVALLIDVSLAKIPLSDHALAEIEEYMEDLLQEEDEDKQGLAKFTLGFIAKIRSFDTTPITDERTMHDRIPLHRALIVPVRESLALNKKARVE